FGSGSGTSTQRDSGVAPGLNSTSTVGGFGSSSGFGSGSSSGFGFGSLSSSSGSGLGGGLGTGLRAGGLGQQGTNRTQTSTQASATDILGGIRVMADELNNSVLVWGTGLEFERIQAALKRLDLPPTQVLIEASIIEVTLNDSLRYGLQWAFSDTHGSKTDKGVLSDEDGGVLGAALKGFSYTISNSSGNVRAVLNALSSKTSIKVVASPTLMVMDNHTASIMVGQQQPIQSGTTINNTGQVITSSIQYKDTGVSLQVTPSVNSGNMVSMTVDQSVTDVGDKDLVTNQRSFLQRQLSSRVAVRSGESIVMGGLIQESNTSGRGGIPVLHELPVVGNLFGSTTNEGRRTELLVIITPKVVRSDVDVKQVSEDLRTQMSGLRKILTPVPAVAPAQP
ncbi:type II secretion system protein GspD, partial [Delftia acidovorans]